MKKECTIIRKKQFAVIPMNIFMDRSLSLKAKGLLTFMLSLPKNWDYTIAGLTTCHPDGRTAVTSALQELIDSGYVFREQHRNEKGQYSSSNYYIFEDPKENTFFKERENPIAKEPISGFLISDKNEQSNTKESNTKESSTNHHHQKEIVYKTKKKEEEEITTEEKIEAFKKEIDYYSTTDRGYKNLVDFVCNFLENPKNMKINKKFINKNLIVNRFLELKKEHINFVLKNVSKMTDEIMNPKNYTLVSLYNAVDTHKTLKNLTRKATIEKVNYEVGKLKDDGLTREQMIARIKR